MGGGNKQRENTAKEEVSLSRSHTALTITIDAEEGSNSAIVHISNAFVKTDLISNGKQDVIIMATRGQENNILLEISLDVHKFQKQLINVAIIYDKLLKSLHGRMETSLAFYQKLLNNLEAKASEINPDDP